MWVQFNVWFRLEALSYEGEGRTVRIRSVSKDGMGYWNVKIIFSMAMDQEIFMRDHPHLTMAHN